MMYLIIFAVMLAIISFTVFFKKLDEFTDLIDSIEESINKICERKKK